MPPLAEPGEEILDMKKILLLITLCLASLVVHGQGNKYIRSVGSLADLAGFTDPFTQVVAAQYGTALGDGNGGVFYRDPASSTATNALSVIEPYTLTGRWKRTDLSLLGGTATYTAQEILFGDGTSTPATDSDLLFNTTGNILTGGEVMRLLDDDASNWVAIQAPGTIASDWTLTLPDNDGDANDLLLGNGSGTVSWSAFDTQDILFGTATGGVQQDALFTYDLPNNRLTSGTDLRLYDQDESNHATFTIPDISANVAFALPGVDGSAGEVLETDGSGNLTFGSGGGAGFNGGDLADTRALDRYFDFLNTDFDGATGSGNYMSISNNFAGWFGMSQLSTNTMIWPHTISTYMNLKDHDGSVQAVTGQYDTGQEEWDLAIDANQKLRLRFNDTANTGVLTWTSAATIATNEWTHIGLTWDAITWQTNDWAGFVFPPDSATNAVRLYINGTSNTLTHSFSGTFGTLQNANEPLVLGNNMEGSGGDFNGYLGPYEIWNRRFWSGEMERLGTRSSIDMFTAKGDAGISGQEIYTSDFSGGTDGWSGSGATLSGNYDSGVIDFSVTLRVEADGTTSSDATQTFTLEPGKLYALSMNLSVISGSDAQITADDGGEMEDGAIVRTLTSSAQFGGEVFTVGNNNDWTHRIYYFIADTASTTIQLMANRTSGAATDEVLFQDIRLIEVGRHIALDPLRMTTTQNMAVDSSGNEFHMTAQPFTFDTTEIPEFPIIGNPNRSQFVSDTFTPALQFGGGSTGITYDAQYGRYQVIGGICYFTVVLDLSSKGSSTGNAEITGFPIPAYSFPGQQQPGNCALSIFQVSGLTHAFTGYFRQTVATDFVMRLTTGIGTIVQDTDMLNTSIIITSGFYFIR